MKKIALGILTGATCAFAASTFAGVLIPPPAALPEPGVLGLLAAGVVAVIVVRLRGRKSTHPSGRPSLGPRPSDCR